MHFEILQTGAEPSARFLNLSKANPWGNRTISFGASHKATKFKSLEAAKRESEILRRGGFSVHLIWVETSGHQAGSWGEVNHDFLERMA